MGAGGIGNMLGGAWDMFSGGGWGAGNAFGNVDLGMFLHGGGIVGQEATYRKPVDMRVFDGAKKYHTGGIAGDEVPAILQKGEGVFTKQQMRELGRSRGQTLVQNFTVGDVASVAFVRNAVRDSQARGMAALERSRSYGGAMA